MTPTTIKILFVGDVVGTPGLNILKTDLATLKEKYHIDFCIVNGENSHEGKGFNESMVKAMYKAGADVITGGDHSFDKHLILPYLDQDKNLLRPYNYPKGTRGQGWGTYVVSDKKIAIINLQGRTFMRPIDCPFRTIEKLLPRVYNETNLVFVDFHAEATAEKICMAWFLDGKVSAMAGTHTHVQTADEHIYPEGMGYITDVGMTGSFDSVIGMEREIALKTFLLQTPHKHKVAENNVKINAIVFELDTLTGKTVGLERIVWAG